MNAITVHVMQYITILMELASFITGLLQWKKTRHTVWKWFIVYLGFIVAGELTCNILSYTEYVNKVNTIFNFIIIPVEFIFFYWLYYQHAGSTKNKSLVIGCCVLYLLSFAADQYFFQGKQFLFDSFSYCIGNLLLLVTILSFFMQFSKGNEILHFRSSLIFWVSLGNLVFYLGTLPYFGLIHLLYDKHRLIFNYYTYLMFAFDWVMYLLFIIGFIKWKQK
jgi:hypothetical protein